MQDSKRPSNCHNRCNYLQYLLFTQVVPNSLSQKISQKEVFFVNLADFVEAYAGTGPDALKYHKYPLYMRA